MNVLCLDIEAVVDAAVWSPPDDKPDAFAPPYAWRPVCIGLVLLEDLPAGLQARRIGAIDDADEATLLGKFAATMEKLRRPTLVTWNGRAYDMPVLMLRSLRYGIGQPSYYQSRDTRYRFTEDGHCDLADAMADYGATRGTLGLGGMSKLVGLPGKVGDVAGASVAEAYAAGRLEEITTYCIGDAVSTAFLWLRWQLLKGVTSLDRYQASAAALLTACEAESRLGPLVAAMDRRVLLLERELAA